MCHVSNWALAGASTCNWLFRRLRNLGHFVGEPALFRTGINYTGWTRLVPAHLHQPAHVNTPPHTGVTLKQCQAQRPPPMPRSRWQPCNDSWTLDMCGVTNYCSTVLALVNPKDFPVWISMISISPLFLFQNQYISSTKKTAGLQAA